MEDNGISDATDERNVLGGIESPRDLKRLSLRELSQLCKELRSELIETLSRTGGHFASSLGVVELTVGIHTVFDAPRDLLVWDVGHQAYIHKMLTGRRAALRRVRQRGGISGFPKRSESNYDSFGVGHAGTSISAATGMAEALKHSKDGDCERSVIAVIGDGAMTAGMAFEALNHSGNLRNKLIVVLNDNEMSIAPNVGALSWAFSRTRTNDFSTAARRHFKSLVELGVIPWTFYKTLDRAEEAAQGFFSSPAMLFESFGYRYIGPVDGHNVAQVITALRRAKKQDGPVLVHALTTKGKGYEPAELDPVRYHGVGPFVVRGGKFRKNGKKTTPTYTEVFGKTLVELAKRDSRIVGVTAAMPDGTGLNYLATQLPNRFYDVGIAEQHAVTFSAGLACEGMRPFCAIYSTFLQRAYDQVLHDVGLQKLPVVFAMDRAGLVGNDGPTHHGVFDIAFLRNIPNMTLMAPKDEAELRDMILTAARYEEGPIAIRYPRGSACGVDISKAPEIIPIGCAEMLRIAKDPAASAVIFGLGNTVGLALKAARILASKGIDCSVVNSRFVKPLDSELLSKIIPKHSVVVTVEDHVIQGGFGSAVLEFMSETGLALETPLVRLGVGDLFVEHASQDEQYDDCGFSPAAIARRIEEILRPQIQRRHISVARG